MTFKILAIFFFVLSSSVGAIEKADFVLVEKSKHLLTLSKAGKPFASFNVVFGANPTGHKQQEGDEKTPEGNYILDYKKANSAFYNAIHINYPSAQDVASAKAKVVSPGGAIMIHGQKNGLGWLSAISQVWESVDVGTAIEIKP